MEYIVYGSEYCPRCLKAIDKLKADGHMVEKVSMPELGVAPDGWRDSKDELLDPIVDHCIRNMELPSIKCLDNDRWFEYRDVLESTYEVV